MSTPQKTEKITVLIRTRESAERTARDIVDGQIKREELVAARDAELAEINSKHNPAIDALTGGIDLNFELLEDWADNNPDEFGKAKSIVICGHRIGWRTSPPAVKPRGKLTLKTIISRIVEAGGDLKAKFLREKPELNKEAILEVQRTAEGRISDEAVAVERLLRKEPDAPAELLRETMQVEARATLREIGVEVRQMETFYFEPDREGQAEIRLAGAVKEVA